MLGSSTEFAGNTGYLWSKRTIYGRSGGTTNTIHEDFYIKDDTTGGGGGGEHILEEIQPSGHKAMFLMLSGAVGETLRI